VKSRRILFALAAGIIVVYFLFFVWQSVGRYFDGDDMMNLGVAFEEPFANWMRPMGGLFYRAIYALAGFNPLPFRIADLAIASPMANLPYMGMSIDSGRHPRLADYVAKILSRPSFAPWIEREAAIMAKVAA